MPYRLNLLAVFRRSGLKMTEVCFCGQSLQRSISKLRASFCWDPVSLSSLSFSHPLSLSSSPVRIHYNLLSDKKAKTPITGGKLNFQFLLGITLAVGLSRLQRKTFSQERWGRPHSFSLGMREQEKERQNLWCAHWKTDCIMEWACGLAPPSREK